MNFNIDDLITQAEAAQTAWHRFKENVKRPWGLLGQDWGVHDLNIATGGIMPKKVTTVAALPSMGKTALIDAIMDGCDRWKEVQAPMKPELCIFTWEMEPSELIDRRVSSKTGLSSRDLTMGAKLLSKESIDLVEKTIEEIKIKNTFYHQTSVDIENLLSIYTSFVKNCMSLEEKDGIRRQPICIIDYVGLANFDGGGVRTYGINEFYLRLKQAANRTNGHFILLAQLDKSARKKDFPDLDDLAESQSIERNSDNVILLHRTEHLGKDIIINPKNMEPFPSKGKMLIRIPKCRAFGVSDFIINCDMSVYKFWGINHDKSYKYWELYSDPNFWKSILFKK